MVNIKDLPQNLQNQIVRGDSGSMEKIQYFSADLSYALDIGEIADMYVDTINGTQVLRLTVLPKKVSEYKTIRAAPKDQTKTTVKRKQTPREKAAPIRPKFAMDPGTSDAGLAAKFAQGAKSFLSKKTMKSPDQW
jgi:hypothetical protein